MASNRHPRGWARPVAILTRPLFVVAAAWAIAAALLWLTGGMG